MPAHKRPASRKRTHTDWFSTSLFNMLVDYYPEVQFYPYGSTTSRENVLPVLKELKLGWISIYAKGHGGFTTFPSSLKTEHTRLARDMPAFFREVTREANTKLVLYYSGLVDGIAGMRHPEWRMQEINSEGVRTNMDINTKMKLPFAFHTICPFSDYFDQWVSIHLEEMITRYEPDGIWVDGDWPGPCFCPRCEERFRKQTGCKESLSSMSDETRSAYDAFWSSVGHEWRKRFRALVKKLDPDCLYSAGNVTARKEFSGPFDWRSGDWFSPNNHRYHISASMRRYTTLPTPYDAFTCDTSFVHRDTSKRSRTKTLDRMLQEGATVLANGGQWGYWTYPTAHGAFIPSRMRIAARCAEFARERRDICLKTESANTIAILDSDPHHRVFDMAKCNVLGAAKALLAVHRSPDIIDDADIKADMPYHTLIVPEQSTLTPAMITKLASYVKRGGRILSTGESAHSDPMQKLMGIKIVRPGEFAEGHVFPADRIPVGIRSPWDKLQPRQATELYPLYLSMEHFNPENDRIDLNWPMCGGVDEEDPEPADSPGAVMRKTGKGMLIHIPTAFFQTYWYMGDPQMLSWFREIFDLLDPDPVLQTDAPCFVETVLRKQGSTLLVHFVNGNPGRDLSYIWTSDFWVDQIPIVGPYRGSIRCARKPGKATWEPGSAPAKTTWKNGRLSFEIPPFHIHTCLKVERRSKSTIAR